MPNLNRVTLIGHLGRDPDVKTVPSGDCVATFSIATSRYAKKGEKALTDWHNITAWGKLAEVCASYAKKGDPIYIEGRIQYRDYTGKDGSKKTAADIIAERVQLLGSKKQPREPGSDDDHNYGPPPMEDDDPF